MGRRRRRFIGFAVVTVLAGSVALIPAALAAELTDRQGDTVDDGTGKPMDVPEADILKSWISADANGILVGMQVRKPTDPSAHPAWVDGDTIAEWDLDVNGDSKPDYTVEFSNDDGKVTGEVSRADAADEAPALCSASKLSYKAQEGYTVTIDPVCVGSPSSVAYQASFTYDTNPSAENSTDAADDCPDEGMSPPVARKT